MKTPWTLTWPFLRRRAAEKNALLDDEQYAQTPDPLASVQLPACALARESVAQACATGSASGPTIGTLRAVREPRLCWLRIGASGEARPREQGRRHRNKFVQPKRQSSLNGHDTLTSSIRLLSRRRVKGPVFRPPSGAAYRSVNEQLIVARPGSKTA